MSAGTNNGGEIGGVTLTLVPHLTKSVPKTFMIFDGKDFPTFGSTRRDG
jgi:hypothetical protein